MKELQDLYTQKYFIAGRSPDGALEVLAGKKYKNILLHNTDSDEVTLIEREEPYSIEQKVVFVDAHTFYIDTGNQIDFYDARTGDRVELLEMVFGDRHGDKVLYGFTYDAAAEQFAVLYAHEEPRKVHEDFYRAALFDRHGKVLDDFETTVRMVQLWGKVVSPRLTLEDGVLQVHSKHFTRDHAVVFFDHRVESFDKHLAQIR